MFSEINCYGVDATMHVEMDFINNCKTSVSWQDISISKEVFNINMGELYVKTPKSVFTFKSP